MATVNDAAANAALFSSLHVQLVGMLVAKGVIGNADLDQMSDLVARFDEPDQGENAAKFVRQALLQHFAALQQRD